MVIKSRIFRTYKMLPSEMTEQLKLIFPRGFKQHLIAIKNLNGEMCFALRYITENCIYFITLSPEKAQKIILLDSDFNEQGILLEERKSEILDKYPHMTFVLKLNENLDNQNSA